MKMNSHEKILMMVSQEDSFSERGKGNSEMVYLLLAQLFFHSKNRKTADSSCLPALDCGSVLGSITKISVSVVSVWFSTSH